MMATAVGLGPGDISYSSGAGTRTPAGGNFVNHIRDEIKDATMVVSVLTPNYLASEFCMAELGAVWYAADDKEFYPLCTPSVDRVSLRATLTGIQVEKLEERAVLNDLLQRLANHC